ncbi:MAG: TetR/AcrR family transcriptional regulator [Gemmatimonadetes bacterium]|nr:TetR/AcrR family transcriptional regulator [Gemmatimonadota bacterium]
MPARTVREEADLRTQTLDAARSLIAERGHRDLSMREIARAVGCSVSSLYLYFESRDALIHTLIDEGFQRWYDEQLALNERWLDPWARLEAAARRYVEFGVENPELYEIMYMFHPRSLERLPKELYRRIRRSLDLTAANVLACAAPGGAMTEADARTVAAAAWATLHGVVSTLLTHRLDSRIDRAGYVDRAVRMVMDGVRACAG